MGVGYPLNETCEVSVWPSLFVPLGAVEAATDVVCAKLPVEQLALEPPPG